MGYIRGVVHGTLAGTVIGLCIAPQTGTRTRQQLAQFGRAARDGYRGAERTVRKMTPMVSPLVSLVRHAGDEASEGTVHIHDHTNGRSHH